MIHLKHYFSMLYAFLESVEIVVDIKMIIGPLVEVIDNRGGLLSMLKYKRDINFMQQPVYI